MSEKPNTGAGLRCTVAWTMHQHQLEYLIANSRYAGLLNLEARGEQRAHITLTADARRLDLDDATLFGTRASFIETAEQVVWLQHEARVFCQIGCDAVPGPRFERPLVPTAEPHVEMDAVPGADRRRFYAVSLTLVDPHTGDRYRHSLMLDPSVAAGDLGVRLLELLLGDAECHATSGYPLAAIAEVVARIGCPIASTIEIVDANNCVRSELGSFQIHELVLESVSDEVFGIPADYRDVREACRVASADDTARPGFTRLDPVWIDTGWRPSDVDGGLKGTTLRMLSGGYPDREIDVETEQPERPVTTTQAVYGLRIEQRLLDDTRTLVNRALGPFAGATFPLSSTTGLVVDWLPRLRAGVLASRDSNGVPARGLGTFLFSLLHDVEPPALPRTSLLPSVNVARWGTIRGRGLLDRMAKKRAQELVQSSALTPAMLARLPASVVTRLTAAGTNWGGLTPTDRLQIMLAVLLEEFGAPRVSLPGKIEFNWEDLVVGEFTNYTGTLTFPPAALDAPGICPLITSLRCRYGRIEGSLMLGGITLTGELNRRPGTTYLLMIGASALATLIFPALWWVVPLLGAIGVFVALDTATLALSITDVTANLTGRFVRMPNGVFQLRFDVDVTGGMSTSLTSNVPTGIHQVVDAVVTAVANSGRILLDRFQAELQSELTKLVRGFLGDGFPASLLRLGVPITGGSIGGRDDQYTYIEAMIAAPANLHIPMIRVPADTEARLSNDLQRLSGRTDARHYLSLVSSQNTINLILAALWRAGAFNARIINSGVRNALKALARPPYPSGANVLRAAVFVVGLPQLSLMQATPIGEHGIVELKALLRLEPHVDDLYEWTVTWRARAQTVIGSVLASRTPLVQITTALDQPLDLLANLAAATAQVEGLKRIYLIRRTVTEEFTDEFGKPQTITYQETEENETPFALSAQDAAQHVPLLLEAMRHALAVRDVHRSPRRDGVRANGAFSGTADSITLQSYILDGTDPDDALPPVASQAPAAYIRGDLGFDSGLLFQHLLLSGKVLSIFDPASEKDLTRDFAGVILDLLPQE